MKYYPFNRFMIICALVTAIIPLKTLSAAEFGRLFGQAKWNVTWIAAQGQGIGGLQADVRKKLTLNPQNLSYDDGYLRATTKEKQLEVKISPLELLQAISLVQQTNKRVFEVSLDQTHSGGVPYIDETLKKMMIGDLLLIADLEFAALVNGRLPLPEGESIYPHDKALQLLQSDKEYEALSENWTDPPLSYPQIYLKFAPEMPGLVSLEFRPQVFFRSPYGHPVEVSKKLLIVGERPYKLLIEDVKKRPNAYRQELPALDRAASITAALGIVAAGCQLPRSCEHLLYKALTEIGVSPNQIGNRNSHIDAKMKQQALKLEKEYENLAKRTEYTQRENLQNGRNLIYKWYELRFQDFHPEDTPNAWRIAYDALRYLLKSGFSLRNETKYGDAVPQQALNIAKQQFLSHPIPNDALLQAASALVIFVEKSDSENLAKAKQNLELAIQLSAKHPGDRFEVANIGVSMGVKIINSGNEMLRRGAIAEGLSFIKEGQSIIDRMNRLLNESQVKAYNKVDSYLARCMKKRSSCSSKELRIWEADIARINAMFLEAKKIVCLEDPSKCEYSIFSPEFSKIQYQDVPKEYIDWLHGRFAYLVGIKEPKWKADRLRFLSYYAQAVKNTDYGQDLANLKKELIEYNPFWQSLWMLLGFCIFVGGTTLLAVPYTRNRRSYR